MKFLILRLTRGPRVPVGSKSELSGELVLQQSRFGTDQLETCLGGPVVQEGISSGQIQQLPLPAFQSACRCLGQFLLLPAAVEIGKQRSFFKCVFDRDAGLRFSCFYDLDGLPAQGRMRWARARWMSTAATNVSSLSGEMSSDTASIALEKGSATRAVTKVVSNRTSSSS